MAIITWGPLIKYASGRIGNTVCCRLRDTSYTRAYAKPDNPDTDLQRSNRSLFSMAVRSWQGKAPEEKEVYVKRAVHLNMSGYNLYISEYLRAGISGKKHNNAGKPGAEIARLSRGHGRFGLASPPVSFQPASLLLRFSFDSSSILRLTGRLPEPESPGSCGNRGLFPP